MSKLNSNIFSKLKQFWSSVVSQRDMMTHFRFCFLVKNNYFGSLTVHNFFFIWSFLSFFKFSLYCVSPADGKQMLHKVDLKFKSGASIIHDVGVTEK